MGNNKILYFEGASWSDADISKATIGNCRIRTAFHLDDGQSVYLEISGCERTKHSPSCYRWKYTGFINQCHYITNDVPNDDENKHSILLSENQRIFEYAEEAILKLVNSLGASFTAIKVVPDLGGYHVFRKRFTDYGPGRYNYGDEFRFNPDVIARREAVYDWVYQMEKEEHQADWATRNHRFVHQPNSASAPNFSLWVDEEDPGELHLLRRYNGYYKHWTIRTDVGDTLDDYLATMQLIEKHQS